MKKPNKLSLVAAFVLLLGALQSKAYASWWSVPCIFTAVNNYIDDVQDCHAIEYLDVALCTVSTFFQYLGGEQYDPNFTATLNCYDVAEQKEQRCEVSAKYDATDAVMGCLQE